MNILNIRSDADINQVHSQNMYLCHTPSVTAADHLSLTQTLCVLASSRLRITINTTGITSNWTRLLLSKRKKFFLF